MKIIGRSNSNQKEIVVAENVNYHYGLIICDALNGKMGVVCFNETYYPVMVGNDYELQGYNNHTVNQVGLMPTNHNGESNDIGDNLYLPPIGDAPHQKCPSCMGYGADGLKPCSKCRGTGRIYKRQT